jgi:hypothetical protein
VLDDDRSYTMPSRLWSCAEGVGILPTTLSFSSVDLFECDMIVSIPPLVRQSRRHCCSCFCCWTNWRHAYLSGGGGHELLSSQPKRCSTAHSPVCHGHCSVHNLSEVLGRPIAISREGMIFFLTEIRAPYDIPFGLLLVSHELGQPPIRCIPAFEQCFCGTSSTSYQKRELQHGLAVEILFIF